MKKFISLLIAAILVFTCAATAFAMEGENEVKTFTVTYNANSTDYTGKTPEAAKVETGKETTIADALVMTGYKFAGWNTKADGTGDALVPGSKYTPTADVTLYGKWEKDEPVVTEYTLTYVTGVETIKFDTIKLKEGDKVVLPTEAKEGYKLNGWYVDKEFKTAAPEKMPAADLTVYASYTKLYKLSFDTQDLKKIDAVWLEEGVAITLPNTDVDNYKFIGWFTDKELKNESKLDKMPGQDTVLYASYNKLYKLSFDTQSLKKIDAVWLEEGAAITLPNTDVENYKFMGWFTDAKFKKAFDKNTKMPKADTVLYGCYAIELSKLSEILKDDNREQSIKDSKLSAETFNKFATTLGFEVEYSINSKPYTVSDSINFANEITEQLKKDIKFGDIADVDITVGCGKGEKKNISIYVYNDIVVKENEKSTIPVSDSTKSDSDNNKSSGEKTIDIPDTGAESIAPAVITFITSIATVGGAVVLKKKKEN